MRIAFDLDDTLIPCRFSFPTELPKRSFFARLFSHELLRQGTTAVFELCRQQNCQIWIYTTSYRSPFYIRRLFWLYGIRVDGIFNQAIHKRRVSVRCTKYPPAFGIDLLVDESKGVEMEGKRYRFETLCINPSDENWVQIIQTRLNK